MMYGSLGNKRIFFARLTYAAILLFLAHRFFLNATPSSLHSPPLFRHYFDFTYWAFEGSGLLDLVLHNQKGAIAFDACIFLCGLICLINPNRIIFCFLFAVLVCIYMLTYNIAIVHPGSALTLVTIVVWPFVVGKPRVWELAWDGFRYYVCFLYFASFLHKLLGGSFFYKDMGLNSFKLNLVEYLYLNPSTTMANIYRFMLQHPYLLNWGCVLVFVLEGVMLAGLFTKKYDRILFFVPPFIHIASYFFADVYFMEMLVGTIPFLHPFLVRNNRTVPA